MSIFLPDLNPNSERNLFKIECNYVPIIRENNLTLVLANIPGNYFQTNKVIPNLRHIATLIEEQSSLSFDENTKLAIEASFILQHKANKTKRVFTGSINKEYGLLNMIQDFVPVDSFEIFQDVIVTATDETNLHIKLNDEINFPNSVWEFVGVISIILNIQQRKTGAPENQIYSKRFYTL